MQIFIRLEDDQETDEMVNKSKYEPLSFKSKNVEIFCNAFEIHKDNPVVLPEIQALEKCLEKKNITIDKLILKNAIQLEETRKEEEKINEDYLEYLREKDIDDN